MAAKSGSRPSKSKNIVAGVKLDEQLINETKKFGVAEIPKEEVRYVRSITPLIQTVFENFFNTVSSNHVIAGLMEVSNIEFYTVKMAHSSSLKITEKEDPNRVVTLTFKGQHFSFYFNWEKSWDNKIYYYINISSKEKLSMTGEELYNVFLQLALDVSDLKGKCIDLKMGVYWEKFELKKTTFDDVFIPDTQMHDCKMFLDVFEKSNSMLRYLMVGPPGTCKTEMVTAIANAALEKGVTIIKISIDEYMSDCIQFASYLSPSLVLLDDIDLMLGNRNSGSYTHNLGIFLDVMDGAKKIAKDIGFLATTNSNQLLDMAAQRPGRFHRILNFSRINRDNVKGIIKKSLRLECGITDEKTVKAFTDDRIIDLLHDEKRTGAYIYNVVHMLVLRAQSFDAEITAKWIENEIKSDIHAMEDLKKSYHVVQDKMDNETSRGIGFGNNDDEDYKLPQPGRPVN
jgi:hypothetical protein